jgi:hypothetical protein
MNKAGRGRSFVLLGGLVYSYIPPAGRDPHPRPANIRMPRYGLPPPHAGALAKLACAVLWLRYLHLPRACVIRPT